MDIESAIIEKSYAKLKEATGYLSDNKQNDYDCALDELYSAAIARQSVKSEEVAEAIDMLQVIRPSEKEIKSGEYPGVAESLDLAITALQAYQPWIPVSTVKPEKSGRYLAYVPEHWTVDSHKEGKVIIAYFRELNYEGKRRTWDDGAYSISGEVTHYLPLPEPPKGETT
jgi:hypothetical protein